MERGKAFGTPMSPSTCLESDTTGKAVNKKLFRGMIGSLLYLTASRPDIMFSVCKCARFQSAPKESHLTIVKRIIRYLIGTSNMGLWYPFSENFDLIGYSDADFAGDKNDRKSTSGTCNFLGKSLISWHSKTQTSVALSTTESEAKHIDIKHHFIRDHVENGDFVVEFVDSENQLADIFTKPLLEAIFCFLRECLGITLSAGM
ncbi:secreted RxLR effector protein 161-like [Solanum verrucosum]|uniref:secreted RxLR effector protein 161-like n=1 Tax=Solanum verrucosum TaxID=315347 RepID=UPI0020D17318|nr:secreted RxLR effector protein 161-like [Solanum verrucosum]